MPVILPKKSEGRRKRVRRLTPVRPSRAVRKRYTDLLIREVDLLKAQTANLSDLITSGAGVRQASERLESMAAESSARVRMMATQVARAFVSEADRDQKRQLEGSISRALGADFATILDTPNTAEAVDRAVAWNSSLIRSIPERHWNKVGEAVLDNYRGAGLPGGVSLVERLQEIGGVTENRARFIARDQTAKLTGALNQSRQESIGIESYTWQNSGDARVVGNPSGKYPDGTEGHENHWSREGKLFRWDQPPEDGAPGEAYNCRCVALPVLDLDKLVARYA